MPIREEVERLKKYRVVPVALQTGEVVEKAREVAIETARREVGLSKRLDELAESIKGTGEKVGKAIKEVGEGVEKTIEAIKIGFDDAKKWWEGKVEVARRIDWGDVLGEFKEGELTEEQIAVLKRVEEALRKRGWLLEKK